MRKQNKETTKNYRMNWSGVNETENSGARIGVLIREKSKVCQNR